MKTLIFLFLFKALILVVSKPKFHVILGVIILLFFKEGNIFIVFMGQ